MNEDDEMYVSGIEVCHWCDNEAHSLIQWAIELPGDAFLITVIGLCHDHEEMIVTTLNTLDRLAIVS